LNNDFVSFPVTGFQQIKKQMLNWSNQFNICCFLDNNNYQFGPNSYECLAGIGALDIVNVSSGNALQQLKIFQKRNKTWLFGHLGYDIKNEIEQLSSLHPDNISFPDLFFFVPQVVLLLNKKELAICSNYSLSAQEIFAAICSTEVSNETAVQNNISVQSRFSKQEYIETIEKLRQHIRRGDCYEINFCQEFFAEHIMLENPLRVYQSLGLASPTPFAAYYKMEDKYLLCASPERYLKKQGNRIISQPIKGTGKRDLSDTIADQEYKQALYESPKDRSENIMVVDLVRNDLSRICTEGTVNVEELFGIYSFPQVHQMISTITGELKPGIDFAGIARETFPMGSMTGAPKRKVMQLIEQYEKTRRGIFSGAVGYIQPSGDFDFNVVIRSILYNQTNQYLSYLVGSGITFYSNAEQEYDECLLKAEAIKKVLA
jgi:para-aminobenzoate synthetase component 1